MKCAACAKRPVWIHSKSLCRTCHYAKANEVRKSKRLPDDCMVLASDETRRQLKLVAAISGETMKACLSRLVAHAYTNQKLPAAK